VEGTIKVTRTINQQQGVVHNVLSAMGVSKECQFQQSPPIIAEFALRSQVRTPHLQHERFVAFDRDSSGVVCYNGEYGK
jgi:hypothetical protein